MSGNICSVPGANTYLYLLHFDAATFPMQFISMDLIGEFHPPTSRKH